MQNFAQNKGSLVIVGGALSGENKEVYTKFIELCGGVEKCFISIIPTASGCAMSNANSFKNNLIKYGVKPENIYIAPISVVDCDETKDVDESKWIVNANNKAIADTISMSTGIWFTGGDQSRTIKALRNIDGSNSHVLNAILGAYEKGAVIGGSSAGAAIMSPLMITGGVSISALRFGISDKYIDKEQQDNGPLTFDKGLGFFTYGIVDQHFDRKSRLGRLIVACVLNNENFRFGFGIDENTAMVYYAKTQQIEAIGAGGVTIVDATKAIYTKGLYYSYDSVYISFIEQNDKYCLETKEFSINQLKNLTTGREYYNIQNTVQSGIFSSYSTNYKDLINYKLIDNKATDKIVTYCVDDDNFALQVTFSKTNKTKGYWSNKLTNADNYSFVNVKTSIVPVKVKITTIK